MSQQNSPIDSKNNSDLEAARKNWEEKKLNPSMKRGKERREKFETSSGIEIKRAYDPEGLFFVRHGVGSEGWSEDGFTRQVAL